LRFGGSGRRKTKMPRPMAFRHPVDPVHPRIFAGSSSDGVRSILFDQPQAVFTGQ